MAVKEEKQALEENRKSLGYYLENNCHPQKFFSGSVGSDIHKGQICDLAPIWLENPYFYSKLSDKADMDKIREEAEGFSTQADKFCPDGLVMKKGDELDFKRFPLPGSFCLRLDFKFPNQDSYKKEFLHIQIGKIFDFTFNLVPIAFGKRGL